MAHWDTSALVKLSVAEPDSVDYHAIAAAATTPPVTAFIARYEAEAVFRRREGEGSLPRGEADVLIREWLGDIANGDIVEIGQCAALDLEYTATLRACLLVSPPVLVRTNDALHLAAAKLAGETEFVTADIRQRAAATHLGFHVLP